MKYYVAVTVIHEYTVDTNNKAEAERAAIDRLSAGDSGHKRLRSTTAILGREA